MRILDVNFVYDEYLQNEDEQLKQHYTSVGWAEALQRQGADVYLVKRFSNDSSFVRNNVHYYFIKDRFGGKLTNKQFPLKLFRKIVSLEPDLVHLHELSHSLQTLLLRILLKKSTAIVIQHHGGPFPGHGIKKKIHDTLNSVADGYLFTTVEHGQLWFPNKKFHSRIMPVLEGCPVFNTETMDLGKDYRYVKRAETRTKTNMTGNPVFIWVGRLDNNKDPLTVLTGFEILTQRYPDARLYMIYNEEKLLREVKLKISSSENLKRSVTLLGRINHAEREMYYKSADYFVLGSHHEGTCYSLSEALACGCPPIVTNIPGFRRMTNDGQLGALWEPGNIQSFMEAALLAMSKPIIPEAEACIDFFNKNISFDAISNIAVQHYRKAIDGRIKTSFVTF